MKNLIKKIIKEELIHSSNIKDNIEGNYVPLTDKAIQLIYDNKIVNTFHISSWEEIDKIKQIVGRDNAISTFIYADKSKVSIPSFQLSGKRGGIIYQIRGKVAFNSKSDLGSIPDKSGRRWVGLDKFPDNFKKEFLTYDKKNIDNIEALKKYYIFTNNLIQKYSKDIIEKNEDTSKSFGDWDEIIVKNIKVLDVLVNPKVVNKEAGMFDTDESSPYSEKELIQKLQGIATGEVSNIQNPNDILKWFIDRGGKINR